MQTSFMHPPFGFALFYLRSVAPAQLYIDKVTKRQMAPVTTGQIYWGAIPYVVIQLIMVGLVIAFPQMVLVYKDDLPTVDPSKIEINIPGIDAAPPPVFGLPPAVPSPGGAPPDAAVPEPIIPPPSAPPDNDPLQNLLKPPADPSPAKPSG
jgi:hypothetical protein